MKIMDSIGLKMCHYQAGLFELSKDYTNCSSKIFIRRFMNSELAKRMDRTGVMFDALDKFDAIKEIEEQYGASNYGIEKFTSEELYWMGYMYRYWSYVNEISSKQIYKTMKPEQLKKMYYPYHSLDPLQAIERIKETIGVREEQNIGDIAKGVEALRKVRMKQNSESNQM